MCVCVCQRKTKDRADGMREKSAHCPRRDSNLYLWDTRPLCFRVVCVCVCAFVRACVCKLMCEKDAKSIEILEEASNSDEVFIRPHNYR